MEKTNRVTAHTPEKINQMIRCQTDRAIEFYFLHPELINGRLKQLRQEWDIERMLEANAASFILTGIILSRIKNRKWLSLSAFVAGFLLEHAVQGWCPPLPAFRRLGIRTKEEIARELTALKAIRGDFDRIGRFGKNHRPTERLKEILAAVNGHL